MALTTKGLNHLIIWTKCEWIIMEEQYLRRNEEVKYMFIGFQGNVTYVKLQAENGDISISGHVNMTINFGVSND